jgi:hypothetical protein
MIIFPVKLMVLVERNTTPPETVISDAPAKVAVFAPELVMLAHSAPAATVKVNPFALAVINTESPATGNDTPAAPPSVADHVLSSAQLPVALRYLFAAACTGAGEMNDPITQATTNNKVIARIIVVRLLFII